MELQPVRAGGATDVDVLVVGLVEEDPVADDAAVRCDRHELLRPTDREVRERIDPRVAEQPERVGALEEEVDHVMGLVEQHSGLPPRLLLAPPVAELGRHDRIDVGAQLGVAEHVDDAAALVDQFLQVLRHQGLDFLVW